MYKASRKNTQTDKRFYVFGARLVCRLSVIALTSKITAAKQLCLSRCGNVGILLAMLLFPIISAVGMSVDFSQAVKARSTMQNALDTAVLAAGRTLQLTGSIDQAVNVAQKHFNTVVSNSNFNANLDVTTIDATSGTLDFTATGSVDATFTSIMGFDKINVSVNNAAELAQGGEGENHVEISLMLDTTGSMSGSKMDDLQLAAKDLINIVFQGNTLDYTTTRVALVPFSEAVNIHDYASAVIGTVPNKIKTNKTYKLASKCVSERTGPEAYTDAPPAQGQMMSPVYTRNGNCKPKNDELVPLTTDKVLLDTTIDNLSTTGGTAGHLGTMWAWYTLSPRWNTIWPTESQPAPYNDEKVTKIAVLMTDGEYNRQYDANGILTSSSSKFANGSSRDQARATCENMKAAGITVYSVGFALNQGDAQDTMQLCATSDDHFFLAENGQQLREAFREIAFQIAQLRLTK